MNMMCLLYSHTTSAVCQLHRPHACQRGARRQVVEHGVRVAQASGWQPLL